MDVMMLSRNDANDFSSSCPSKMQPPLALNMFRGQKAQQTIRVFNSICVSPLQQFAANGLFKYNLNPDANWLEYTPMPKERPGCDESIVPHRPPEMWVFDTERESWTRQFAPTESRQYFSKLQKAPNTFDILLDRNARKLRIECNPKISVHRAAHNLIDGRGDSIALSEELTLQYRMVDAAQQTDPTLDPFHVSNCESLGSTSVGLNPPYELYDRQKKAVTKMAQIEDESTEFVELEMFEEEMPGATGWSLISKASRKRRIHGGVLADAIGAGSKYPPNSFRARAGGLSCWPDLNSCSFCSFFLRCPWNFVSHDHFRNRH